MRKLHGVEQSATTDGGEQRIATGGDAVAQLFATRLGVGHKAFLLDDVQCGQRGGGAQRIACESGAVGTRGEQRGQFGAEGNHAAHRETTANALGESDDVRGHTAGKILTLEGEPCSGASDAGLHFVDDEERLMFVA